MSKKSVVKRKKKPSALVPLVLAILVAVVFWQGTEKKIQGELRPTQIPFAATNLTEHKQITKDDIVFVTVPGKGIPPNVIVNPNEIVNKYVNSGFTIPKNSMFYQNSITELENIQTRIPMLLEDGKLGLTMKVNLEKSVANSLRPGMDIQVRFYTDRTPNGKVLEGVLEDRIKILAVRDAKGTDVKDASTEDEKQKATVPTVVVFEADKEQSSYLIRASRLGELNILAVSEKADDEKEKESKVTKAAVEEKNDLQELKLLKDELELVLNDVQLESLEKVIQNMESYPTNKINNIKLYIDTMTYTLDDLIEYSTGYFITLDKQLVVYEDEKLRYYGTDVEYQGSIYTLQDVSEEEFEELKEQMKQDESKKKDADDKQVKEAEASDSDKDEDAEAKEGKEE